jgi:hypothetical protein
VTVTLAVLRTRSLQRADMENSTFVAPSELLRYINSAYLELYDLLVSKGQEYYVKDPPTEFTVATGAYTYTLPTDFYKLLGVDRQLSADEWIEVRPFNFNERNANRRTRARLSSGPYGALRRRVIGNKLFVTPNDLAPGTYRLWYVPRATELSSESDTVDGVNGWEEYIVLGAAIRCLAKEESDVSVLTAEQARLTRRIEEMAAQRDVGDTERVTDVTLSGYDPYEGA